MKIILFLFSLSLFAKETICLNMIVKDESAVICRCLESVKPFIDYWVIVDTGSSDGTQKIIRNYLKDIPGELYSSSWKDFGTNRTEAFQLAFHKGDYILFIDADDILKVDEDFSFSDLTEDLYTMWRGVESFSQRHPQLVKGDLPWKYVGVTHEYLACDVPYTTSHLDEVKYITGAGGNRSVTKNKFLENVRLLEEDLKKDPENERSMFYLAESYRDAGEKGKALEWFQRRVNKGGWAEEVFWSLLQIGHLLHGMGFPKNVVTESYLNALRFRPTRVEPIYFLVEINNQAKDYETAFTFLQMKDALPKAKEKDSLFNMDWIEDWGLTFLRSVCTYHLGKYQESLDACDQLLANPRLPESWRTQTIENRKFPLEKLCQK